MKRARKRAWGSYAKRKAAGDLVSAWRTLARQAAATARQPYGDTGALTRAADRVARAAPPATPAAADFIALRAEARAFGPAGRDQRTRCAPELERLAKACSAALTQMAKDELARIQAAASPAQLPFRADVDG